MRELIVKAMKLDRDYAMSTWRIARNMRAKTPQVRRELLRMEREGLVCRLPYSAVNNTIWRLTSLPPNDQIQRAP